MGRDERTINPVSRSLCGTVPQKVGTPWRWRCWAPVKFLQDVSGRLVNACEVRDASFQAQLSPSWAAIRCLRMYAQSSWSSSWCTNDCSNHATQVSLIETVWIALAYGIITDQSKLFCHMWHRYSNQLQTRWEQQCVIVSPRPLHTHSQTLVQASSVSQR